MTGGISRQVDAAIISELLTLRACVFERCPHEEPQLLARGKGRQTAVAAVPYAALRRLPAAAPRRPP